MSTKKKACLASPEWNIGSYDEEVKTELSLGIQEVSMGEIYGEKNPPFPLVLFHKKTG